LWPKYLFRYKGRSQSVQARLWCKCQSHLWHVDIRLDCKTHNYRIKSLWLTWGLYFNISKKIGASDFTFSVHKFHWIKLEVLVRTHSHNNTFVWLDDMYFGQNIFHTMNDLYCEIKWQHDSKRRFVTPDSGHRFPEPASEASHGPIMQTQLF
jgi:hypothetical protein